jgi:hypothetical protein
MLKNVVTIWGTLLYIYCPRKRMSPIFLVALIAHHTPTLTSCNSMKCIYRRLPVIFWVHIFTEINRIFIAEQKECGRMFYLLVTTASSADDSRLAESANFYVVRYLTGSEQWYEQDKLRTSSNGISSHRMCRQKNNNMRNETKERVTPISVDTVPPRILPEKQHKISQLWVV